MASLNRCAFIGNLGKDPETRYLSSGDAVTNFSIACTETWKDKATQERKEKTEWVSIAMFGKLAEIAEQYLTKGSSVYVEGSLQTRKWQDKEGKDRYSTEIKADKMVMLGGKSESGGERQQSRPSPKPAKPEVDGDMNDDLDIPF